MVIEHHQITAEHLEKLVPNLFFTTAVQEGLDPKSCKPEISHEIKLLLHQIYIACMVKASVQEKSARQK